MQMMTYLAQTKGDRIQLPPAIADHIRSAGWHDILISPAADNESLTAYPLPHPNAPDSGHTTQLDPDSGFHLSEPIRHQVALTGQSVMVRIEGDVLRIYLRHVFKTLGFRPA
jgi:hypothetical protein